MLRASEFTVPSRDVFDASSHFPVADAQFHSSSNGREYLTFHIKRSQTEQRRQGITLYTGHSGHPVCAVCALTKALAIRDRSVNPPATPR